MKKLLPLVLVSTFTFAGDLYLVCEDSVGHEGIDSILIEDNRATLKFQDNIHYGDERDEYEFEVNAIYNDEVGLVTLSAELLIPNGVRFPIALTNGELNSTMLRIPRIEEILGGEEQEEAANCFVRD